MGVWVWDGIFGCFGLVDLIWELGRGLNCFERGKGEREKRKDGMIGWLL